MSECRKVLFIFTVNEDGKDPQVELMEKMSVDDLLRASDIVRRTGTSVILGPPQPPKPGTRKPNGENEG